MTKHFKGTERVNVMLEKESTAIDKSMSQKTNTLQKEPENKMGLTI
ncbi:MAG: hypothetical protein HRU36_03155 [Rickettsiales bacterium]|nr:hypothetical protein [Rickettsiales bacterium]